MPQKLLLLTTLFFAGFCYGQDRIFYVDPTQGDDNSADGSKEQPYKNIDYAVEQAVQSEINLIHIVEGVHYG